MIEFVNSTTPDEDATPGTIAWTAAKVVGAATKIALEAKAELETNAAALGFDPAQITTIVNNHGGPYAKYLLPPTPPSGKDKTELVAMWDVDGAWLRWFWPFATVAVTYTDRIGFGKNGDGMRGLHEARGGVPFQGSLRHALTWYNSTPVVDGPTGELDFAVLVNDLDLRPVQGTIAARVLVHNLGAAPQRIGMRAWQLPLGTYTVRGGPDANGDDQWDFVAWTIPTAVIDQRGATFLSGLVGADEVQVVEFELLNPNPVITLRADPAIGASDVAFGPTGQVSLTVHNLGALATTTGVGAQLERPDGTVLETIPSLPVINAAVALTPQSTLATFSYSAAVGETIVAKLLVPGSLSQITTFNDQVTVVR